MVFTSARERSAIMFIVINFFFLPFTKAQPEGINGKTPDEMLQQITDLTAGAGGNDCAGSNDHVRMHFSLNLYPDIREKVDLVGQLISDAYYDTSNHLKLVESFICRTLYSSPEVQSARIGLRVNQQDSEYQYYDKEKFLASNSAKCNNVRPFPKNSARNKSWYRTPTDEKWDVDRFQNTTGNDSMGRWTFPYFQCKSKRWMISYVWSTPNPEKSGRSTRMRLQGSLSVDIDISKLDINQCNTTEGIQNFINTNKCHRHSSTCLFVPGLRWQRGGYKCECKEDFFSAINSSFNGLHVEVAWQNQQNDNNSNIYDRVYKCLPNCSVDNPCDAEYNMPFRIVLLSISMMCIFLTLIVMSLVFHYRSIKVFKVASPVFLQICLFGCIVMYLEMATIFPVLETSSCIATKWTRHMGFCITFSSLLMKTWRVSLTYRVKSAHKIKLTDKQLLQWMMPILLIMITYVGAWTISDPPTGVTVYDNSQLSFKQCKYGGWDHTLAIGEMLFLIWGVKVCYGVRKAESFFDEAKCISYAVYNIAIVNVIMASVHLYLYPKAGPDLKYFFGFIRTQMSTSATIGFVFGPKLLRVVKGTGNQLDNHASAKGVSASFSINGIGGNEDAPPDPLEENEELKEEIQKLASQIEFMKIVHMEMNNRHLKPRPGGYFTEKKSVLSSMGGQSPSILKTSPRIEEISSLTLLNPTNDRILPERV